MKISSIQIFPQLNVQQNNFFKTSKLERTPSADTVSFSASKPQNKTLKPRIQTAVDYSQEILQTITQRPITLQDLSDITTKYSKDVKILSMNELKNKIDDSQNYGAFFTSQLKDDFKASDKEMYVTLPKANADKMEKLLFAMSAAHEFTHVEQMDTNEAFNQLKSMSKGNYDYAKAIMGISDVIFKFFDTQIQAQSVLPVIQNCLDKNAFLKYGCITPTETPFTRQMFTTSLGLNNEKEFQQIMKSTFDDLFKTVMISISQNQPEILGTIPKNENYETLKKKVRSYCALKASTEKEAYTTEAQVAKKAMGTEKSLNIDVFPIFYDNLEKAFS